MYQCRACTATFDGWIGQCPTCNQWNSVALVTGEIPIAIADDLSSDAYDAKGRPVRTSSGGGAITFGRGTPVPGTIPPIVSAPAPAEGEPDIDDCELPIPITLVSRESVARFITNIPALDHVLGGGLVPGCSVLIGGEPGAGKSTLILMAAASCARWNETRVLYVTGEENTAVIADRAERVGAMFERLYIIRESDPDRILRSAEKIEPDVIIIDSISTMARLDMAAMPGSVAQVRASAELLCAWCAAREICLVLIGHVTKDGAVAGPSTLKHLVDTVLHLNLIEGSQLRTLRAHKNRNGDTGAVGRFMMGKGGLESVGSYRPDVADSGASEPANDGADLGPGGRADGATPDTTADTGDREPLDTGISPDQAESLL